MPFTKGDPNCNRKGRPTQESSIAGILRRIGNSEVTVDGKKITRLEKVMDKVFDEAEDGQPWAVNFIADRTEGKPLQVTASAENMDQYEDMFKIMSDLMGTTHGEDTNLPANE